MHFVVVGGTMYILCNVLNINQWMKYYDLEPLEL